MKKPVIVYLSNEDNPVDLESLDSVAGKIEFESLKLAFDFISTDYMYKRSGESYKKISITYNSIQKYLKRYSYFKTYTFINGFFFSILIKNI